MVYRAVGWIPLLLLCSAASAQTADSALAAYKAANYEAAIPLLEATRAQSPGDPLVAAALLSSFVYQDRADAAATLSETLAGSFPESPDVTAARGECAFYLGDMPSAERLFRSAAKLRDATARAYFGLSRLYRAASFYRTARLYCLRAHEIDPDDALVTKSWLRYVPAEKRHALEPAFAAAHPWLYPHYTQDAESAGEMRGAIEAHRIFEVEGGPQETTQPLVLLMRDARRARGVGLEFRLNGGRPLRLLLDTGASGILLKQGAVDKAELEHLGSGRSWGIGDKGTRNLFGAVAETCQIAKLKFHTCIVSAMEGKGRIAGDEDGLIGADVFSNYLISLDFERHTMHLKPLPVRAPSPQGYDREIPPDEKSFTPVFRFGHSLLVSTKVNGKSEGLFLLDTGSEVSNIDAAFARLSTKVHGNEWIHISGVSGQVKDVFEADKAELQFAHFRQSNLGLIAINLNYSPEHSEVRMSGILGLALLAAFHLTIDYRNGLVDMEYHPR